MADTTAGIRAMILDLDGVITRTATVHATAWKQAFDEFLAQRDDLDDENRRPFEPEQDYHQYVDGKPRYDGVRSFLASRGVTIPDGTPEDGPDEPTVCGLGNRKNDAFQEILEKKGAEVFDDAVVMIRRWRDEGLTVACVSSSKNCRTILQAVELIDLFDTIVDGNDAARLGLPGKPHPDTFQYAADQLKLPYTACVVFEDAISGVQAGAAGGFGATVGVARSQPEIDLLAEHGADFVVSELTEYPDRPRRVVHRRAYDLALASAASVSQPPSAVDKADELAERLQGKRLAVFLDYDGTLSPIVPDPDKAVMADSMREAVDQLAQVATVAIVSGRDRRAVENFVQLSDLVYAGSHGFDIKGPNTRMEHQDGQKALPTLDEAEKQLAELLGDVDGVALERKRYAIAIHYRQVAEDQVGLVERAVDEVYRRLPDLRKGEGKKVFELQPDLPWNKGYATLWLLDALDLDQPDVVPIYIGDDVTDEDAFRALRDRQPEHGGDPGFGIFVGELHRPTAASYRLEDVAAVERFLRNEAERIGAAVS